MKVADPITEQTNAVLQDLRIAGMANKVALPGAAAYDKAREIWNGAVEARPAFFALCETNEDVQNAVRVARKHHFPLSVRSGGHDFAGRSMRHDGMVIDLTRMRSVKVDSAKIAKVGGGATAKDIASATIPEGLIATTGSIGAVGVSGLFLGGGYSPFTPKFGLLSDNLLEATVVLADGTLVTASPSENPDLFWALRGGGGNFGVVTSMTFRLHRVRQLMGGVLLFPWAQAEQVLRGYADLSLSLPDEMGVNGAIVHTTVGVPAVLLTPYCHGERELSEKVVDKLRNLGTPFVDQVGWTTYDVLLGQFDAMVVNGNHYAATNRCVSHLTPETIATIIANVDRVTSPLTLIAWHHFRGAGPRVASNASAFGLRKQHFLLELVASWKPVPKEKGEVHRKWLREFSDSLAPFSFPGGYPNMLGPDDHSQIPFSYGDNAQRLMEVKRKYDPDNVFSSALSLPK